MEDITNEQQEELRQVLSELHFGIIDMYDAEYKILNMMSRMLGSRGGKATKAKYGKEHYQKLAANMNKKRAEKKASLIK